VEKLREFFLRLKDDKKKLVRVTVVFMWAVLSLWRMRRW